MNDKKEIDQQQFGFEENQDNKEKKEDLKENEQKSEKKLMSIPAEESKWFVPLLWENISKVLSLGIISPNHFIDNYTPDVQSISKNKIIILKDGISKELYEQYAENKDAKFIGLLEINLKNIEINNLIGIDGELNIKNIGDPKQLENNFILLFPGFISSSSISAIHFNSDEDRTNFKVRGFENVPNDDSKKYDVVKLNVSPNLFEQKININFADRIKEFEEKEILDGFDNSLEKANAWMGSIVLLFESMPAKKDWFDFSQNILINPSLDFLVDLNNFPIIKNDLERKIFSLAFSILSKMNSRNDFQSKKFIENIHNEIDKESLSKEDSNLLKKWYQSTIDILDNKKSIPKLSDDHMMTGRAILLLALRPKYTDILQSKFSSIEAGDSVVALASILIGSLTKFSRLPNDIKSVPSRYQFFSNLFENSLNSKLKLSKFKKPKINVEEKKVGELGNQLSLLSGKDILVSRESQGPDELVKILLNARTGSNKMHFDVDRENQCLIYNWIDNNRKQVVYISVGSRTQKGSSTVRISSPCLDLTLPEAKKILNEGLLYRILITQNLPELYCRIGIDEKNQKLLVIKDLLAEHSTSESLEMVEEVAKYADNFEKEFGFDHF